MTLFTLVAALCLALTSVTSAATLFALVDTGELFASTDSGDTWVAQSTLPVSDAAGLLAASVASELFLTSRTGTVYQSLDAGFTWTAVGAIAASDVVDVAGRTDGALLALTRSGVLWISTDNGISFTAQSSLTASDLISIARGDDGTLLALTETGTVRQSVDGGDTWNTVGVLPVSDAVTIRPIVGDFFVLTDTGLAYQSVDQGASWTAVGTVSQVGMRGLVEIDGNLVAIERSGRTMRSPDGVVWSWAGTVNQVEVVAVASDVPQTTGVPEIPQNSAQLFLAPPHPNPHRSNAPLEVRFRLPTRAEVNLRLYDSAGRSIATRSPELTPAGDSSLRWELPAIASGVYFLELATNAHAPVTTRLIIVE